MTLLVVLVELLIPWLKSEVLSSCGCLPSCWRTGQPLAKVCMATGAPHILPSLHIIDLSQHIGPLFRGRVQLFAENTRNMVVWYDFFAKWGKEESRTVMCVANTLSYANCCIRWPALLSLGDFFFDKNKSSRSPFPLISVTLAKDTLLVGHLEAFYPYITWRLNVDLVEWPAAFKDSDAGILNLVFNLCEASVSRSPNFVSFL